jgi:hypothetical protein
MIKNPIPKIFSGTPANIEAWVLVATGIGVAIAIKNCSNIISTCSIVRSIVTNRPESVSFANARAEAYRLGLKT